MAHSYTAETLWERGQQVFSDKRYSRKHTLRFDGGISLPGSSSPLVVPVPFSDPHAVDPEEMLVCALSSCHMLWFLSMAVEAGYVVDSYHDCAVGEMQTNGAGRLWVSSVCLRPRVVFSGPRTPDKAEVERLHHGAHEACFIANSVKTAVQICPL